MKELSVPIFIDHRKNSFKKVNINRKKIIPGKNYI